MAKKKEPSLGSMLCEITRIRLYKFFRHDMWDLIDPYSPRLKKTRIALWIIIPIFVFYMAFVNYTQPSEIGIARNSITGEMWIQKDGGWHFTLPWVFVSKIDTRPMRVAVTTSGHGYSAKLVRFNTDGWQEFVAIEGFRYYWWSNRFSINFGYDEEYRGMKDIMRGHAYSAKKYSFVDVITEYQSR